MVDVRKNLIRAIEDAGLDYKEVSLSLGRNPTYIQQFIKRGIPRSLKEEDRRKLSALLKISEFDLGYVAPDGENQELRVAGSDYDEIPEYDVNVSAGGGAIVEAENIKAQWPFNPIYLENELRMNASNLLLVEVRGDSMEPTLSSGDRVMVDRSDMNISQPGIFVLHDGDGTVVKRLEKVYDAEEPTVALMSDNKRHNVYHVPADRIVVVGRVIWCAKRL